MNIWEYGKGEKYAALADDYKCDAAVIGGGITGVLCAHLLAMRGLSVALFEEKTIGHAGGKTARSTAKATVAHELIYSRLAERISAEASRKYAAANLSGLRFLRDLIECRGSRDMYLYALHGERRLRREFLHLRENGIKCEYIAGAGTPLPIPTAAAIRLHDQLLLDPVRLIRDICAMGHFRVFENSVVSSAGKSSLTCNGHTVSAEHVIVATNYPVFHEISGTPMKLCRKSSYAVAVQSDSGFSFPDVMAFGADGGYGYRYANCGKTLIVSGETHRGAPSPNTCERLIRAAAEVSRSGKIDVIQKWSNNDTYAHDGIPYVGRLRCGLYIACGYGAWGMTNSAAAALILAEQVCGDGLWYDDIFSPYRNFLRGGASDFAEHMTVSVGGAAKTLASPPDIYAGEIKRGQADIVNYRGRRAGAYRDNNGFLHLVSLRCPHLGCSLEWNSEEATWDCPCHGSRFSYTGECLSNPAALGISLQ